MKMEERQFNWFITTVVILGLFLVFTPVLFAPWFIRMNLMMMLWAPFNPLRITVFVLIIAIIAILMIGISKTTGKESKYNYDPGHAYSLEILKERYAKGEITREKYLKVKEDIERT